MPRLAFISGIPLYSTQAEAEAWAAENGLSGYHTHMLYGQTGYMGGFTHHPHQRQHHHHHHNQHHLHSNITQAEAEAADIKI